MKQNERLIEKIWRFPCADCPTVGEFPDKDAPKAKGWAIAAGGKKCYCPACALKHRSTGCKGFNGDGNSAQQISISGV